ncbi:MAG: NUDIX hydrolase [Deltaproteobacteria bacterium]|nr:NUDIX hydrolase [Deltaproteobacteria bacterium]
MKKPKNPIPAVDIIIELKHRGIVLIQRENPPLGWAIPGGFVDYGETLEHAAEREALEETCLKVRLKFQFHSYSDPKRDNRVHTISTVFVAEADGMPQARDDAKGIGVFKKDNLPQPLVFDHCKILEDYFRWKQGGYGVFH